MELLERRAEMVIAAKAHFAADMLMKGTYGVGSGKKFKGCSVGCLAHEIAPRKQSYPNGVHAFVADHYGYPSWLAYLQDTIFEGLPNGPQGENSKWHVQLAETLAKLPADFDWDFALHRVHAAILRISYRTAGSAKEVVQHVLELHERAGRGEDISDEIWSAARSAAWSAAESAAESAAWSAARSAAVSAAWSAARSAAWSAARSAAESAAWSAARSAAFQDIRDAVLAALPEPALSVKTVA
ncbi:MAG: hypothetical protein JWM16_6312 [Verrucomicrobiales bacterium]|nr:hypothetical protein [Verrucomicrobiales bacterium]